LTNQIYLKLSSTV